MFQIISFKIKIKKLYKIFLFIWKVQNKKKKESICKLTKAKSLILIESVLKHLINPNKMYFKMKYIIKTILLLMTATPK